MSLTIRLRQSRPPCRAAVRGGRRSQLRLVCAQGFKDVCELKLCNAKACRWGAAGCIRRCNCSHLHQWWSAFAAQTQLHSINNSKLLSDECGNFPIAMPALQRRQGLCKCPSDAVLLYDSYLWRVAKKYIAFERSNDATGLYKLPLTLPAAGARALPRCCVSARTLSWPTSG